jgi:hypothetical protein
MFSFIYYVTKTVQRAALYWCSTTQTDALNTSLAAFIIIIVTVTANVLFNEEIVDVRFDVFIIAVPTGTVRLIRRHFNIIAFK